MRMAKRMAMTVLVLLAGIGTAAADIRVDESRYQDGKLIIHGITEPDLAVTLDGKYKVTSDSEGKFRFVESYKPDTCMSDIRAGDTVYSAVIAGCLDPTFSGDTMPAQRNATRP